MENRRIMAAVLSLIGFALPHPVHAFEIEKLSLSEGRNEENTVDSPVLDAQDIGPITIGEIRPAYDADDYRVYLMKKSLLTPKPKHPSPHYKLAPSVNLASLFQEALRSETAAMGLTVTDASPAPNGWRVSGTLHEIVEEIRPSGGGFGPLLFFGYVDVELVVAGSGGGEKTMRLQFYNMSQIYNAGYGVRDEAREALAQLLVESAQETIARLNRAVFHAPPHPSVAERVGQLQGDIEDQERELLLIGLSGSTAAVPHLLELLESERDEGDRTDILNALANIGSPEALDVLSRRYRKEDEDCRFFTLKAMDYIDDPAAREFLETQGVKDKNLPCRVLAHRATDG